MSEGRDWRHSAACRDEDPELFFPVGRSGPAMIQAEAAKAVCRRCSVASQCLEFAIGSGESDGIWGGLDPDERTTLKVRGGRYVIQAAARDEQLALPPATATVGSIAAGSIVEGTSAGAA